MTFDLPVGTSAEAVFDALGYYQITAQVDGGEPVLLAKRQAPPSYGQTESYTIDFQSFMRDIAVARRMFCHGMEQVPEVEDEYSMHCKIQQRIHPGGLSLGWHGECSTEGDYLKLVSQNGNRVACSLSSHNFSLMQHAKLNTPPRIRTPPPAPMLDPEKVYVSFIVADGDALGILYHLQRGMFLESSRGKLPLNWAISALLADFAPPMLQYFIDQAGETDCLIAAASGAGYSYTDQMNEQDLRHFARMTAAYVRAAGFNVLQYYGTPTLAYPEAREIDDARIDLWQEELAGAVIGVIDGYWANNPPPHRLGPSFTWARTMLPDASVWGAPEPQQNYDDLVRLLGQKPPGVPLFIPVHPWIDRQIGPDMIAGWVEKLGDQIEVVRLDHMMLLMQQWAEQNPSH